MTRTEYQTGYESGFARGLAYFTAEELSDIALHLPPAAAYDSIRTKIERLESESSVYLLASLATV